MADPVDCFRCAHFVITYETKFPYACRVFAFKGRMLPSSTVLESTGQPCTGFQARPERAGGAEHNPGRGGKDGWLV